MSPFNPETIEGNLDPLKPLDDIATDKGATKARISINTCSLC